jgi:hypothetical protein
MIHKCPRCGYSSINISNFRKHVNRKEICNPIVADVSLDDLKDALMSKKKDNTFVCEKCMKKYASKETLRVHKLSCAEQTEIVKMFDKLLDLHSKLEGFQKCQDSSNVVPNIVIHGNVNNQQNIINVGTSEFLQENIDYLSDEYMVKCAKKLNNGLIDFIRNVRFNPDHPENMNVKVHRIKQKTLYIFRNNRWEISDAKWTLEEMIIHGARILHQKILTHFDQEKLLEADSSESKVQQWLLSLLPRNNEKMMGILSKRLYAMILDNQLLLMEQPNEN